MRDSYRQSSRGNRREWDAKNKNSREQERNNKDIAGAGCTAVLCRSKWLKAVQWDIKGQLLTLPVDEEDKQTITFSWQQAILSSNKRTISTITRPSFVPITMKNFLVPLLCLTATSSALAVAPRHAAVEESGLEKRSVGRVAGIFIQFLRGTKAGERTEGRLDHLGVGPARPYVCYWWGGEDPVRRYLSIYQPLTVV